MKVLHYSNDDEFSLVEIKVQNDYNKPGAVLWVSPQGSEYGWKEFCEDNEYSRGKIRYELEIDTENLLVVNSADDFALLPWYDEEEGSKFVDFEEISTRGITGLWLTLPGLRIANNLIRDYSMIAWDCESIAIFDSSIVKTVNKREVICLEKSDN